MTSYLRNLSPYVSQRNYNNPRYDFINTLQWNKFKQNSTIPPFCFKNTKSMIARQINSVNCVRQIECFHCFNCINDRLILYYCADRYLLKGNYRDRPRVKIQFNHFLLFNIYFLLYLKRVCELLYEWVCACYWYLRIIVKLM